MKRYDPERFLDVFRMLDRHGVRYVLCGGFACYLHGVSRVTNDLDVCIALSDENVASFLRVAQELRLTSRIPEPLANFADPERRRVWREEKRALVLSLRSDDGLLQIDVFLQYPVAFEALTSQAVSVRFGDVAVRVSSAEHLIEAKRQVDPPRPQDVFDIQALQQIEHERAHRDSSR